MALLSSIKFSVGLDMLVDDMEPISRVEIKTQIDRFARFIDSYCPLYGPLRSAFQHVKSSDFLDMPKLENYAHSNTSDCDDGLLDTWGQAYLDQLASRIGMGRWNLQFIARDKARPKRATDKELHSVSGNAPLERYYTDSLGRPVIYFEPSRITENGYVASRVSTTLSEILLMSAKRKGEPLDGARQDIVNSLSAFLGMGLGPILAADMTEAQKNKQCISCAIYLSVKGYSRQKALSIHGADLSAETQTRLSATFRKLEHYSSDIEMLRASAILADQQDT